MRSKHFGFGLQMSASSACPGDVVGLDYISNNEAVGIIIPDFGDGNNVSEGIKCFIRMILRELILLLP